MATGEKTGVIEVVSDSATVCDIHMDNQGNIVPRKIHEWFYTTTGKGEA